MQSRWMHHILVLIALLLFIAAPLHAQDDPAQPDATDWPVMGMNIYAVSYYDGTVYFIDATRHASSWISFNPENFDVWDDERPIEKTENGYPAALADDQAARTILFIEDTVAPAGDYTLTWVGIGTMQFYINGEYRTIDASSGQQTTLTIPENAELNLWLEITATDPADPLRDIHLWLPGYSAESESIFTPWFKAELANFNPIRLMDWTHMNETDVVHWEDRAQMDWHSWGGSYSPFGQGVPYEVQIDLANEMNSDLWLNIPHSASDDYVTQLAALVHERLNPDLRVWVEYTNEHWNPLFPQNIWLFEQSQVVGEEEGLEEYYLYHHYGRRAGEVLQIFEDTFADAPDRVIGIIGGLAGWAYPAEATIQELEAQGQMDLIDALAIAPYIGNYEEDGSWNVDALVAEMDTDNLTEDDYALIFEEMNRAVDEIYHGDGEYAQGMRAHRALAEDYGLALVAYEAGQHLTAYDLAGVGFAGTVEAVEGVYNQVNTRPEMYDLYMHWLDEWEAFGGDTLVPFHLAGSWNEIETFGHKETILQPLEEAHKYRALLDWLATQQN